jgi:spherulation-specific family 4 protein
MTLAGALGRRAWIAAAAAAAVAGAAAFLLPLASRDAGQRQPCRGALIPAYVEPGAIGELAKAPGRGRLIVINPASGPGGSADRAYEQAVRAAKRSGARVLGYVPTGYGTRPAAAVEQDVDRYRSWYGVDGVFLDEASANRASLYHYRALSRHVRATPGQLVVMNPGVVPARGYFGIADVIVTFEGPVSAYAGALSETPAWVEEEPRGRIAHLIYGASREQALAAVRRRPHAQYVYAAAGSPPHPWSLPDYLDEEEALLDACP